MNNPTHITRPPQWVNPPSNIPSTTLPTLTVENHFLPADSHPGDVKPCKTCAATMVVEAYHVGPPVACGSAASARVKHFGASAWFLALLIRHCTRSSALGALRCEIDLADNGIPRDAGAGNSGF